MEIVILVFLFIAFNVTLVWTLMVLGRKYARRQAAPVRFLFYCSFAVLLFIGNYSAVAIFINLLR